MCNRMKFAHYFITAHSNFHRTIISAVTREGPATFYSPFSNLKAFKIIALCFHRLSLMFKPSVQIKYMIMQTVTHTKFTVMILYHNWLQVQDTIY